MVGYWGSGLRHTGWVALVENVPERLDRLIADGAMPPVVVAFPDCATKVGGNQYLNSAGTGRYADYLIQEIVPFVEEKFGCGGTGRRACFGKSSGGFGAAWHGLHYADFWTAIAINSGDMGFDALQLTDLYEALNQLQKHGGSIEKFWKDLESKTKASDKEKISAMVMAMSAFYDPDPNAFRCIRLPCDPYTGELIPERWNNWLRHDPVNLVDSHVANLRKLKAIYMDCGDHDQYRIHFGMRRFHRKLESHGIAHVYEEFDDDHTDVDYRMDKFLPFLAKALAA
jgi:S-formylglutathione hydrolase FrmB